ncbi:MAG: hypothetical protein V2J07_00810, partial [Anaerolineae bacterium]|nr:hypothetical protein [Anaerolineae bacterium]
YDFALANHSFPRNDGWLKHDSLIPPLISFGRDDTILFCHFDRSLQSKRCGEIIANDTFY